MTSELKSASSELAHRTQEQAAALEQTSASVVEMASGVQASESKAIDANGQVLRKIFVDPAVMPDEKFNIARGFGHPNSTYLYEIFLKEF
jgi:hypothetical protein